jgi:hypothetical protein
MRIDDQRLAQLVGSARETREYQHAGVLRILRGDELLGDKVHAVAQGRDEADGARTIKARQAPCA